jgi:hypothetical protein
LNTSVVHVRAIFAAAAAAAAAWQRTETLLLTNDPHVLFVAATSYTVTWLKLATTEAAADIC